jgi:hypothetical protein
MEVEKLLLGLNAVKVAEEDKEKLFAKALRASEESIGESQAILEQLMYFDPSTARDFTFQKKSISKTPFRLLTWRESHPGNELSDLFDSFIAVSYCWHSDDWRPVQECEQLDYAGRSWPISEIMLRGLLERRISSNEGIWIDASCIDQVDDLEKRHAISSMDMVYKSARQVFIILEDVLLSRHQGKLLAEIVAHDTDSANGPVWYPPAEELRPLSLMLITILSARWFTRAWCSQEFQLASDSRFIIPLEANLLELSPTTLENLYWYTRTYIIDNVEFEQQFESVLVPVDIINTSFPRVSVYRILPSPQYVKPFMAIFRSILELQSSIETDKLSIAMNLAGLHIIYNGKERSHNDCRWILSLLALSAKDVTILGGTGVAVKPDSNSAPSAWLRWLYDPPFIPLDYAPGLPEQHHITAINPNCITLDLLILEHRHARLPTPGSTFAAAQFVDHCLNVPSYLEDIGAFRLLSEPRSESFLEERAADMRILACSLSCGINWISENVLCSDLIREWTAMMMNPNGQFPFSTAFTEHIVCKFSEEERVAFDDPNVKTSIFQYVFFVLTIQLFNECKDRYPSGFLAGEALSEIIGSSHVKGVPLAVFDMGEENRAITLASNLLQDQNICCAVPVALSDSSSAMLRRLCLLKPLEDGSWQIVEKLKLFSYKTIKENGTSIIRRPNQKLYG